MLPEMVHNWRESWGDSTLPFYFAQLSGLNRPSWPEFRETQRRIAGIIPESGMVVTTDTGHPTDVHPRDKRSVGERLALLALNDTYGFRKAGRSPEPVRAVRRGNTVIVTFRPSGRLKTSDGLTVREIEVSLLGNDFKPATGRICGNHLKIDAPGAVAVRYGWKPYSEGNLTGESGLPVSTFRLEIN
jgi:sialate O-acetylesterase